MHRKNREQIIAALIRAEEACLDFYTFLRDHLNEPHHKSETTLRTFLEATIKEEQEHIRLFRSLHPETKTGRIQKRQQGNRRKNLFLTAFVLVFLAELGDKTQLTAFSATAATAAPLAVFIGASAALILSSLIAISIGKWLSTKIRERTMSLISSFLFLGAGIFLYLRHFNILG